MNTKNLVKKAFTLVELIIVIAIIAILAVTAFLLLTKWLSKARDSSRASNLANIEKSLQISLTDKSSLPKPDSYTLIYASGTSNVIGYQGFFGEGVKDAVGNINSAPKDGDEFFTYYLNADLNKYQLAGFLENTTAYNKNVVNAVDYSARFVTVKGDKLGLLTDANKSPLQTLGLTGLDLLTGNTSYTAYMDNSNNVAGTGKQLFTYYYNQTKSLLQNKDFAKNDSSLIGYWDMETLTGTLLADLSQYGNNGICYNSGTAGNCGTVGPTFVQGKVGKAMQFDGVDDRISIPKTTSLNLTGDKITVFVKVNPIKSSYNMSIFNRHYNTDSQQGSIILQKENRFAVYIMTDKDGFNGCRAMESNTINYKDYNNFVFVYDGNYEKLYDNYDYKILSLKGNMPDYPKTDYQLGSYFKGSFFNGLIDEVRIYNRALSDDEVKALYKATN